MSFLKKEFFPLVSKIQGSQKEYQIIKRKKQINKKGLKKNKLLTNFKIQKISDL